jgi:iron complex outermembrane recepter protein
VTASRKPAPLTVAAWPTWGAYSDAVLTQDFPAGSAAYGVDGNRLPLSSRVSGQLSLSQEFPLRSGFKGFAGSSIDYVGNREGLFISSPTQAYYPAYARTDASAGVTYDSWGVNVFANNITDRRGIYGGGPGMFPPFAFEVIQPRTVGMSVTRLF